LIEAARKRGRNGPRDACAILLAYRHGLRAAELCSLRWSQIDLQHGRLHVNRAKGGIESVHPLHGPELRALRPLQESSPYVFVTEAGTPTTLLGSCEWSREPAVLQGFPFKFTHTCSDIAPGTSLRMMSTILARSPIISVIGICNRQRGTLHWRRIDLRNSGRTSGL
jgi:integrase